MTCINSGEPKVILSLPFRHIPVGIVVKVVRGVVENDDLRVGLAGTAKSTAFQAELMNECDPSPILVSVFNRLAQRVSHSSITTSMLSLLYYDRSKLSVLHAFVKAMFIEDAAQLML